MGNRGKSFIGNIGWIFAGNVAHAVLSFLISIVVVRHLTTNDNGIINYAGSWISFYHALSAMGINSIVNKFTTEDLDESNSYLTTAVVFRVISGMIGVGLVVVTVLIINPGENIVLYISAIQGLSIVFSAGDTLVYWFRYKRQANVVAVIRLIAFLVPAVVKVIAIVVFKNLYLYTIGLVLETLLFSLLLFFQYRKRYTKKLRVSFAKLKVILSSSYPFIFSAVLATIYAQTDRVMLKNMVDNSSVAYYSVAVTLAGLMTIVTSAIIEGFRPEIIGNHNSGNQKMYEKRLTQAYAVIFWICIAYGLFITVFAKQIILFLYGEKYLPSVPALSLIVWYTSFSYFGTINNIFMVAEDKQKWVQVTTLIGTTTNVILNAILIPSMGIVGAAAASFATQFVGNIITPAIIPSLRPIVKYCFRGIALKGVLPGRK